MQSAELVHGEPSDAHMCATAPKLATKTPAEWADRFAASARVRLRNSFTRITIAAAVSHGCPASQRVLSWCTLAEGCVIVRSPSVALHLENGPDGIKCGHAAPGQIARCKEQAILQFK